MGRGGPGAEARAVMQHTIETAALGGGEGRPASSVGRMADTERRPRPCRQEGGGGLARCWRTTTDVMSTLPPVTK